MSDFVPRASDSQASPRAITFAHEAGRPAALDNPGRLDPKRLDGGGLIGVAWRQRRWLVTAVAFSLLAAAAYLLLTPRVYRSTAQLYLDQVGPEVGGEQWGRVSSLRSYLETQAALIVSRPVLSAALEDPTVARAPGLSGADRPVEHLRQRLLVDVGRDSELIGVSFDSTDPNAAAAVVNGVVQAYFTYQSKRRLADTAVALNGLQEELRKVDSELRAKLDEMMDAQGPQQEQRGGQAGGPGGSARDGAGSDTVRAGRAAGAGTAADRATLFQQMAALNDQYLASRLERIQAESEAERLPKEEAGRRLRQALEKEKAIGEAVAQQRTLLAALHDRAGGNAVLESQVRRAEALRASLETRVQDLTLVRRVDLQPLRVWDSARVPEMALRPRKARVVASAVILGVLAGWMIGLARESRGHGPRAPGAEVRPGDESRTGAVEPRRAPLTGTAAGAGMGTGEAALS